MNIHKNGKRWWFYWGWYSGACFKLFGIEFFENTGAVKGDWCFFHLQVFKFVVSFGRWA